MPTSVFGEPHCPLHPKGAETCKGIRSLVMLGEQEAMIPG